MNNNTENEKVFGVVYTAIRFFNEQLSADRKLSPNPKCELVGSARLDSVEIVNLMVMIEQQVEQDLGIRITLFDAIERLLNVQDVVDFVEAEIGHRNTLH